MLLEIETRNKTTAAHLTCKKATPSQYHTSHLGGPCLLSNSGWSNSSSNSWKKSCEPSSAGARAHYFPFLAGQIKNHHTAVTFLNCSHVHMQRWSRVVGVFCNVYSNNCSWTCSTFRCWQFNAGVREGYWQPALEAVHPSVSGIHELSISFNRLTFFFMKRHPLKWAKATVTSSGRVICQ